MGFPGGSDAKESTCIWDTQVQSLGRAWQPTSLFLLGESP